MSATDLFSLANREIFELRHKVDQANAKAEFYQWLHNSHVEAVKIFIEKILKRGDVRAKHDPIYRAVRPVALGLLDNLTGAQFYELSGLKVPETNDALDGLVQKVCAVAEELDLDVGLSLFEDLNRLAGEGIIVSQKKENS